MSRPDHVPGYCVVYIRRDRWTGAESIQHGRIWRTREEAQLAADMAPEGVTAEIEEVSTFFEARAAESFIPATRAA